MSYPPDARAIQAQFYGRLLAYRLNSTMAHPTITFNPIYNRPLVGLLPITQPTRTIPWFLLAGIHVTAPAIVVYIGPDEAASGSNSCDRSPKGFREREVGQVRYHVLDELCSRQCAP
jgi:hypothetical protein